MDEDRGERGADLDNRSAAHSVRLTAASIGSATPRLSVVVVVVGGVVGGGGGGDEGALLAYNPHCNARRSHH
jgi:hypothetical protein